MKKWPSIAFGVALVACSPDTTVDESSAAGPVTETNSEPSNSSDELALKSAIENGLTPSVVFAGDPTPTYSIEQRMEKFPTPAISIAYAKGGEIVWADTYGDGVDTDTMFQAASMSKAVASVGIAAYAEANGISLDDDVDALLPEISLREISPDGAVISLRALLSHTAGATVGGFPGYAIGEPVPSNLEVVTGGENVNTPAVVFNPNPDAEFNYSGGGYQVAQAAIEAHSGQAFEITMANYVLTPSNMTASTFVQKTPGTNEPGVAKAHDRAGSEIEGGWNVYPEHAAAGLWTTPSEYVNFVYTLMNPEDTDEGVAISSAVAAEVLTPVSDGYGLGIGIEDIDGRTRWRHGGANRGYRSFFLAFPDTQEVFVMMTNSANGSTIGNEIIRSAGAIYGWPGNDAKTVTRADLTEEALAKFVGAYALPNSSQPYASLAVGDGVLVGTQTGGGEFTLVPLSESDFIDPDDGQEITFSEEDGEMLLNAGGTILTRVAAD
ncbi:MAG: serine hydrolase domain-containing protein [Pseudomonadota bacterium]